MVTDEWLILLPTFLLIELPRYKQSALMTISEKEGLEDNVRERYISFTIRMR